MYSELYYAEREVQRKSKLYLHTLYLPAARLIDIELVRKKYGNLE
jgi:hypothetical protein